MASTIIWPHPSEMVSITQAAKLLECNRSSLSRQIQKIRDGNPPQTRDPRIDIVARLFVDHAEGVNPAVQAVLLTSALNIPAHRIAQTPPSSPPAKEVRHRISKKERGHLRDLPKEDLTDFFHDAYVRVRERNNLNARRWLKDIIDAMAKREITFPLDRVEGIHTGRFVPFASLADWAAAASPGDMYFFFYRKGEGRPLDYRLLTLEDLVDGATFRFLTLVEWFDAMKTTMEGEAADAEARLYEEILPHPDSSSPRARLP